VKPTYFVTFVCIVAATSGCTTRPPQTPPAGQPVVVVSAVATMADVGSTFEAGGVVRARTTATIASRVMAPIADVIVHPGDRVRRGAPLILLDARELSANRVHASAALSSAEEGARAAESDIQAADASATLAGATFERIRGLQEKRSATPQELDQAHAAFDAAEAQQRSARARAAAATAARDAAQAELEAATVALSYATITAPFDGVVASRSVDPGSMAVPGAPLLLIEDLSALRLEVPLDEARAGQIAVGDPVDVLIHTDVSASSPRVTGRIAEIARIDPAAHSFMVKLDLPAGTSVRSGAFARARFRGPVRRTLTVPAAAAVRRGQLTLVFVIDRDGRARLQPVSPGSSTDDRLEVLAGIADGDRVVLNPPPTVADGMPVTGGGQ
jgi:multidrug efflux pump subunit AcrA (membrane-fusion protein)